MRMSREPDFVGAILAGVSLVGVATLARAQEDQYLMPEQSQAKAHDLINQAVEALGGSAYMSVKDVTCTGRISSSIIPGEVTGFGKFIDYLAAARQGAPGKSSQAQYHFRFQRRQGLGPRSRRRQRRSPNRPRPITRKTFKKMSTIFSATAFTRRESSCATPARTSSI